MATFAGTIEVCCHQVDFYYTYEGKLSDDDKKRLTEEAENRARDMIGEGDYVSGELCYCITGKRKDRELRGWWSIHKEPVSFIALISFDSSTPDPTVVRVSHTKQHFPNETQFSADCETIESKYNRASRSYRANKSLNEYFDVEIEKMGWRVEYIPVQKIIM